MFDQGRGFEWGEGREFVIPLMAFFLGSVSCQPAGRRPKVSCQPAIEILIRK